MYTETMLKKANRVSIAVKNSSLDETLAICFTGQPFTYKIINRTVVVQPTEKEKVHQDIKHTINVTPSPPPPVKISGKVVNSQGMPLQNASVIISETKIGTTTDNEGRFTLTAPDNKNIVLEISSVGYQTVKVNVGKETEIKVTLNQDISGLEDIVVVGYGTQKKENLTGSVTQIDVSSLGNRPTSDVATLLQGVVAGLNINSPIGGELGAEQAINIRGIGSLSGNSSPYILVDGVPMDLSAIDPNQVESVTVLKDAAASAIYGSRAAFGVILITTKNGKKNKKPVIEYSGNYGWQTPIDLPKSPNSLDFANAINYSSQNSGASAVFPQETIDRIIKFQKDPTNTPNMIPIPGMDVWPGTGNLGQGYSNANTDWSKVFFKNRSARQSHNLAITGGGAHSSYYIGTGMLKQDGLFNFVNTGYTRYNFTANIEVSPTTWLSTAIMTKYMLSDYAYPVGTSTNPPSPGDIKGGINNGNGAWPTYPVYNPSGDIAFNRLKVMVQGGEDLRRKNQLIISPEVKIKFTKNWKLTANFDYHSTNGRQLYTTRQLFDIAPSGKSIPMTWRKFSQVYRYLSNDEYLSTNIFSDFTKQLGDFSFKAMVGFQAEKYKSEALNGWKMNLISPDVTAINAATGNYGVGDALSQWATEGYFGRINFSYKNKYLLETNGRYDGSSRFAAADRWGLFPSASLGYIISKENFWKPLLNVVDFLKLRVSYGSLGNQNVPGNLSYILVPTYANLNYIFDGMRPAYATAPGLGSSGLTWESIRTKNLGIDITALQSRLSLTADIFDRKTLNMFGPGEAIPNLLGTSAPRKNNATLGTKGIEISAGWRQTLNNFNYGFTLNYSDNKSVVLEYNNPTKILTTFYEGMTIGELWGFKSVGLFQNAEEINNSASQKQLFGKWSEGDVRYTDINGDGKITYGKNTATDPGDQVIIGNSQPRKAIGLSAFAGYKGFDFKIFFQGILQRDVYLNDIILFGFSYQGISHTGLRDYQMDYWTPNNTNAYYPKPYETNENLKNQLVQTRYLLNAHYLRLKNLQIGYNLSDRLLSKMHFQKLRLYLSGENLLTFSGLPNGIDPESTYTPRTSEKSPDPFYKSITFGIQISL